MFAKRQPAVRFVSNKRGYSATFGRDLMDAGFDPREVMDKVELERVILPSALRRALPYYSNEVILMLHATTVAFTATVPDILKIARDVNSATYQSFNAFGIAALLYLCISFALVWLFRRAERRWLAYLRPQGK
jgi:ABC-type arginine/histidine transport system permease subunit